MKLDLIKKLTRLANNNPNEHEANLAARRVCRMLEEHKFSFVEDTSVNKKQHYSSKEYSNISYDDIFKTFYGVRWEGFDFSKREPLRTEPPQYQNYYKEPVYRSPFTEPQQSKPVKEKRTLKCTRCKKEQETIFAGLADVYICNPCQWADYTSKMKDY